jgi:hypothetical protein
MYTDPYHPAATPTPQGGLLKSLLFDPAADSTRLHELNQPSSYEPVEQVQYGAKRSLRRTGQNFLYSILISPFLLFLPIIIPLFLFLLSYGS